MNLIGSTSECLKHFTQKVSEKQFVDLMYDRFRIPSQSTLRWYRQEALPKGMRLIQLQVSLNEHGYQVLETKTMPEILLQARVHVANGKLSLDELAKGCDSSVDVMERVISNRRAISKERLGLLGKLMLSKFDSQSTIIPSDEKRPKKEVVIKTGDSCNITAAVGEGHTKIVDTAVSLIRAFMPLATSIASDAFTADERARFRQLLGEGGIQELRFLSGMLTNESVRKDHIAIRKKES